jgi:periplasmic protein CpxP/Spy
MKQVILFIAFTLAVSFSSFAQQQNKKQPKTPEERAEHQSQRLTKELSLSADQTSKVKAVLLQKDQQEETIRNKYANATDKKGEHTEMKTLREQKEAELKQIFTPDQFTKYEAMKKQHKENTHNNQTEGQGGHKGHQH